MAKQGSGIRDPKSGRWVRPTDTGLRQLHPIDQSRARRLLARLFPSRYGPFSSVKKER